MISAFRLKLPPYYSGTTSLLDIGKEKHGRSKSGGREPNCQKETKINLHHHFRLQRKVSWAPLATALNSTRLKLPLLPPYIHPTNKPPPPILPTDGSLTLDYHKNNSNNRSTPKRDGFRQRIGLRKVLPRVSQPQNWRAMTQLPCILWIPPYFQCFSPILQPRFANPSTSVLPLSPMPQVLIGLPYLPPSPPPPSFN